MVLYRLQARIQLSNLGTLLLFIGLVDLDGLEFVDLDRLIGKVFFRTIVEALIVGSAGIGRAVMLGAAYTQK
jgi:hypothetical protein